MGKDRCQGGDGGCDKTDKYIPRRPLTFGEIVMEKNPQRALQMLPELREQKEESPEVR